MTKQANRSLTGSCSERTFSILTLKLCTCAISLLLLVGCASYGKVVNTPLEPSNVNAGYSLRNYQQRTQGNNRPDDIAIVLAFSGGGTRAAAMAYGILSELRDTQILTSNGQVRLLDEVDHITSVSGGSFTAAYYGLYGEDVFNNFEEEFLRANVNSGLSRKLMNPGLWFSSKGRTESAIEYYEKTLFHGATFADMNKPGRPMIVINASDLAYGVRFSFIQDYFNLLCSDLSSFPVARAVAASSAVPVLFNPVVVENHSGCDKNQINWPDDLDELRKQNAEFNDLYKGLITYANKDERRYIHFVDGGITDNMGLRAILDIIQVAGGAERYFEKSGKKAHSKFVVISVDASTSPLPEMDKTPRQPSMLASMSAMSGIQLHRYNSATMESFENKLSEWTDEVSTPELKVNAYFIPVSFEDIDQPQLRYFLNKIPTTFSLSDEEVDKLIESGRQLLRNNETFQQLLSDLGQ